jgi:hypothetical protein
MVVPGIQRNSPAHTPDAQDELHSRQRLAGGQIANAP